MENQFALYSLSYSYCTALYRRGETNRKRKLNRATKNSDRMCQVCRQTESSRCGHGGKNGTTVGKFSTVFAKFRCRFR